MTWPSREPKGIRGVLSVTSSDRWVNSGRGYANLRKSSTRVEATDQNKGGVSTCLETPP
ncbi:hypothetical protein H6G41_29995 [Tolypothrix sp. FACHB-123]|uniref:hypothetical protein n=1 Tax=Tolypothrix sp. FACHB-123 TaxID=2692868 RepID=UPI0016870BAF|nr:hypothetical protein [Tolypothrix sp. FACHB-123]MBD2358780.1 hypothetical protein [Tolypothrix sp. FACHB-123]